MENETLRQDPTDKLVGDWPGCLGVVLLALPAQYLVYGFIDVYMQGYNSWRDSLWVVPLYLVVSSMLAVISTIPALLNTSRQNCQKPMCVFVIARMLVASAFIMAPIALSLAKHSNNDWQPHAARILYFLPAISVIIAFTAGFVLFRMHRWSRVITIFSLFVLAACGGIVARWWLWMTSTSLEDWLIFPVTSPMIKLSPLWFYLLIILPVLGLVFWCLTRRNIVAAFNNNN